MMQPIIAWGYLMMSKNLKILSEAAYWYLKNSQIWTLCMCYAEIYDKLCPTVFLTEFGIILDNVKLNMKQWLSL